MYRYLPGATADYDYTLNISSATVIPHYLDKPQIVHGFLDGRQSVVDIPGRMFDIELQWDYVSESDRSTILDLFHDPAKANGRARTFQWDHPRDEYSYVVRFLTPLRTVFKPGKTQSIETIKLRIVGVVPLYCLFSGVDSVMNVKSTPGILLNNKGVILGGISSGISLKSVPGTAMTTRSIIFNGVKSELRLKSTPGGSAMVSGLFDSDLQELYDINNKRLYVTE